MKTTDRKKKTFNKYLLVSALILILICTIGVTYYTYQQNASKTDTPPKITSPTPPTSTTGSNNSVDVKPSDPLPTPKTPESTGNSPQTANISIASQTQTDTLYRVRTLIDVVTADGTCHLTLTQGNRVVTRYVAVQAGPSSSTCAGFDIPLTELSSGSWSLSITFKNTTYSGALTQQVSIR